MKPDDDPLYNNSLPHRAPADVRLARQTSNQQLAEPRKAGMVSTRRQARQIYYRLANDATEVCVRSIEAVLGAEYPALVVPSAGVMDNRAKSMKGRRLLRAKSQRLVV